MNCEKPQLMEQKKQPRENTVRKLKMNSCNTKGHEAAIKKKKKDHGKDTLKCLCILKKAKKLHAICT